MSSNRFFSSSTSRFPRGGSSNQDDTLLAPVLDRGGRVPDYVDARLAELSADYRLIRIRRTEPRTGPGGPNDLAWVWPVSSMVLLGLLLIKGRVRR